MEITNINFLTIMIFFLVWFVILYSAFYAYDKMRIINLKFNWIKKNKFSYLKYVFLIMSFFILFASIFGIKIKEENKIDNSKWIDVVFVLDVSKSMNVADIESKNYIYTRLDFAKNAVADFVSKNTENRYSLVIFAWEAVSSVPLTNDKDIFLSVLNKVDYKNLTIQGSDFYSALALANERLNISEDKSKAIIFISDWWDDEDFKNKQYYEKLKDENIVYFVAWIWTPNWWKIITWRDVFGRLTYQTYQNEYVISKLNENNLKEINAWLDWTYQKLDKYSDINLFSKSLDKIEKKVIENNSFKNSVDATRKLSFISFTLFLLYLFLYLYDEKIYLFIKENE